jgi:catechol 2,3-dioxygenase-like lactoylglutathione lyase family enzyme
MNIIDHLSVGVADINAAEAFYSPLLAKLNILALAKTEGFVAYGTDAVQFLIMKPENGEAASQGNGSHVCFRASSQMAVDAFHTQAIAAGGVCAGEPGPRAAYPLPDVYTTFIRDPFGNKLEAIFQGFAGVPGDE